MRELADGREDGGDGFVVVLVLALQLIELAGQGGVGDQELAQADERADHKDAHLDGSGTVEDGGGHDGAVLGEGEWRKSGVTVLLGTGHKL